MGWSSQRSAQVSDSAGDGDVVVRVAVIKDKGAAFIVASQLSLVCVHLVDVLEDGLTIDLQNNSVGVDSGGSELSLSASGDVGVATNDGKVDAVGAA